jgi:predicted GH43/DUF377 family glycosyl hydrolase
MCTHAQSPSVVIYDEVVRVYINTRPPRDENGNCISYMAYVDLNRKNLLEVKKVSPEPLLPLGKTGTFDEFGIHPSSVIKDGNDFRLYYAGTTRCESVPFNSALGVAISNDNGETFTRIGDGPVLSYSADEPFVLGSPKIRKYDGVWYFFYSAGRKWIDGDGRPEPVYKVRLATSKDGFSWVKVGRDLLESRLEENECQASADVFRAEGRYHMFFSYRYSLGYKTQTGGYRIGYAVSDDLLHWERNDKKAGITVSEEGWDSQMISYPCVFELDGAVYMLYLGNDFGKYGFGLARLEGGLAQ